MMKWIQWWNGSNGEQDPMMNRIQWWTGQCQEWICRSAAALQLPRPWGGEVRGLKHFPSLQNISQVFWLSTSPPEVPLVSIPLRLPLCDYPAEGRVREEPRVRRQENGFCQQIKFTDNSQKKVKLAQCQEKNSWRGFPLLPILLDLSAPVYFPNNAKVIWLQTTNFMAQLTLNMTVTQITFGGNKMMRKVWCKCWNPIYGRLVLRCTTGMEPR